MPPSENDITLKNRGIPAYCPTPSAFVGNPINAATGNKLQIETDYAGAAVTGLEIVRTYNSQDEAASPFGANWRSTWHRALAQPDENTLQVTREDGRVDTFVQTDGMWTSDPDVTSRLYKIYGGWLVIRSDDSKEVYSSDGRLLSVTARNNLSTVLDYDADNRLATVTGPFGHKLGFAYNSGGRIKNVTLPDGNKLAYAYDSNANLTTVTYPDGGRRRYLYENAGFPHALTGIEDESGVRFATYEYDADGRAISSEHAGGADSVTVAYDGGAAKVTDARGNTREYAFMTQYDLVKPTAITPGCCGGADYTYDDNGFLSSKTDYNGNVTRYTHNARGLETSRTEAEGTAQERTTTTQWHATFHLPLKIAEPERVTTFEYDANGNMLTKTVTAGTDKRSWYYSYNEKGQILKINGARTDVTDVTRFAYGDDGLLASITNPAGHVTRITSYDANGNPVQVRDPNGLETTLAYDARGRLATLDEGGEVTRYAYTPWGGVSRITMPDGSFLAYTYDDAHRLTQIKDARGNRIAYMLDKNGNRVKEEVFDANGELTQTRRHAYDKLDRLAKDIGAQGQTTAYARDDNGNVTAITDPLGNKTVNAYDALNRLVRETAPNGSVTGYAYTAHDEIRNVTDPRGVKTTYARNGLGDVTVVNSRDSGKTVYTHDAAGNVVTATDARGQKTKYAYDKLNRVKKIAYADGTAASFQYDQGTNGIGRLTRVVDASGSTTFAYDKHGRETVRRQKIGDVTLTTQRAYDAFGRLSVITYPSGKKVRIGYDPNTKLPVSLSANGKPLLPDIGYRPFGPVAGWVMGNGAAHDRFFDADGLLAGVNTKADTLWLTRDKAGRIANVEDSLFGWRGFEYDKASRLIEELSDTAPGTYAYDKTGNRVAMTAGEKAYDYGYPSTRNRLSSIAGPNATEVVTHDAAGNVASDGARTLTHGADGRLAEAKKGNKKAGYAYNAMGQRVLKNVNGAKTLFVTDDNGQLLGEYNASGKAVQETVYLDGQPVGVMKGSQRYYINPDHLGAPRTILNQKGQVVWKWSRDAFGNGAPNQKPGSAASFLYNLRLPGQYADAETGLYHNNARDYDPQLGRYIQPDPIGLNGGINPYVYVGNDPVHNIDPWGLVYYCSAPLHLWPESFLEGYGPTHHSFLCDNSTLICGGQDREGNALLSRGKKSERDTYNSEHCKELSKDPCVNKCVIDTIESQKRPLYTIRPSFSITFNKAIIIPTPGDILAIAGIPIPQNCQSWAKNSYTRCLLKCSLGGQ